MDSQDVQPSGPSDTAPGASQSLLRLLVELDGTASQLRDRLNRQFSGTRAIDTLLVLWLCEQNTGLAQNELAQKLGHSTAKISGQLETLRKNGWLRPSRDVNDRRRQTWALTSEGRDYLHNSCDEIVVAHFWISQIAETIDLLQTFRGSGIKEIVDGRQSSGVTFSAEAA